MILHLLVLFQIAAIRYFHISIIRHHINCAFELSAACCRRGRVSYECGVCCMLEHYKDKVST
uniref:Secreted protein n=1 Tax=Rhizophora mucronata TaxID=61149 RepID=A0A2P2J4K9_RHIMU